MRGVLAQIGDKARAVGVVSVDLAILAEDQRIGRTDQRGAICNDVGDLEDRFLMGKRDIEPDKADFRQVPQGGFQICRGHVHGDVMPLDPIAAQPETMQRR